MIIKTEEKKKAIELRKQGLSLNDIKNRVSVAKSTLSLWLREVGLSKKQKQNLTEKKRASALWGALKRKTDRIASSEKILALAEKEIGKISKRELLLLGAALYWAEGSKQKDNNVSTGVIFANSDPNMLKLFLAWLDKIIGIPSSDIDFEIYTHRGHDIDKTVDYWSKTLNISKSALNRIYYKKGNPETKRKNSGENYVGLVRVRVKRGTGLNRRIQGFVRGIVKGCGIV